MSSAQLRKLFGDPLASHGGHRAKISPPLENGSAHTAEDAAAHERQRLRLHYEALRARDSLRPPTAAGIRKARARTGRKARPRPTRERWGLWLAIVLLPLLLGATLVSACRSLPAQTSSFVTGIQSEVNRDVPAIPTAGPLDQGMPQTSIILARDGSTLAEINDVQYGRRLVVPLSQMSPYLIQATIAAEDRRFFSHDGVDPIGFARALMQNANSDQLASGASTLEMQLIRNLYMPDEKTEQTLSRKLREALAARQLDDHASKDEVMETYLNSVFYGNQAYGAEAASERYFGHSAQSLSIAEAALLAGLPQSPTAYDPLVRFDQAKKRQEHVIELMEQAELITSDEASMARRTRLEFRQPNPLEPRFQHWVNYIADLTRSRFGPDALYTSGLRINTTLDPVIQSLAEDVVAHNEAIRVQARANNTAMVVIDPASSQVLAMVGSKDFGDQSIAGQVNVAMAGRQPGSSIKPLVYLAGFEKGLSPAVQTLDQPTPFSAPLGQPPYMPKNYDDKYYGQVTLRDALGNSLNVPAVKVLKYVGVPAFKDVAERFGITTLDDWDPRWLSLTLGGGEVRLAELTGAYAAISRLGAYKPVEPLLGVQTSRGDVMYAGSNDVSPRQVVDPRIAYQLLHVMGDSGARLVTFGPQTPLNLPRPHMLKTGTTDDFRDTWTIGCLPQVCVGVWMGNTNNEPMQRVSSSLTAGKIWIEMMQTLADHFNYPPIPFEQPDGIAVTRIPNVGVTRPGSTDHEEVFLAGQEGRGTLNMNWMEP